VITKQKTKQNKTKKNKKNKTKTTKQNKTKTKRKTERRRILQKNYKDIIPPRARVTSMEPTLHTCTHTKERKREREEKELQRYHCTKSPSDFNGANTSLEINSIGVL
jgi:hypothetical protein